MTRSLSVNNKTKIAIIGMGYVGLPLAIKFGKKVKVIGYDTNNSKIKKLNNFNDETGEISNNDLKNAKNVTFTSNQSLLRNIKLFIIAVPTPVNKKKNPDLNNIISATKTVAKFLSKETLVIYESTVYPGLTEEICKPILEKYSNLDFNKDFYIGYSPERVNPGDKKHTVDKIYKIVSASNNKALKVIKKLYKIVTKKIFSASSIKVAEAAKIIENTQRDVNIALMNELSKIFNKMNINTTEVLEAARTKWNFGNYEPGLVGGHCIGVDPYYLTFKSNKLGYKPKMILSGRKLNDGMPKYVFNKINSKIKKNSKILFLGLTFKENCPDIRNSKSLELLNLFLKKKINVSAFDPYVKKKHKKKGLKFLKKIPTSKFDILIIAVKHRYFEKNKIKILNCIKKNTMVFDIKNQFKYKKNCFAL